MSRKCGLYPDVVIVVLWILESVFFYISEKRVEILFKQDSNWLDLSCKFCLAYHGWRLKPQVRSFILGVLLTVCFMHVLLRGQRWAEFIHKNLGLSFLGSLFSRILSHSLEALFTPSSVPDCSGQKDG